MSNTITKKILLKTPQDVKNFCYAANSFPRNVSVKVKAEAYTVDGKSILGMFSLNLSEPVNVVFESEKSLDLDMISKSVYSWEV